MTREMGALMTAVIMAGRTGAAYAAELGSMQANEEIDALKTFDTIFVITQGGPGTASSNLPFYIYQRAFLGFDIGQAAAMGVVVVIGTIIIATWALRLMFKSFMTTEQ